MAQTDPSVQAIKVRLELENLKELREQFSQTYTATVNNNTGEALDDRDNLNAFFKLTNDLQQLLRGVPLGDNLSENYKAGLALGNQASKSTDKIADDIMKIMKTGIGIIEDIHARLKASSPLLQSVESLFNLAVQLFFMPLGNKLATVMIPAIIDLVDDVTAMWERFEGMDLGEMLNEMITYGAEVFGKFFTHLGEELAEQTGLAGSIGQILIGLGDFVENNLADLLKIVVDALKFIMDNLGTFINLFIEFKIASLALQAGTMAATMAGPGWGAITGLAAFSAVEGVGNTMVAQAGVFDATSKMNRAASGAYVGATEGGRMVTVAEGGEGEFILPESRLQSMMDTVSDRMVDTAQAQPKIQTEETERSQTINNYFTINGYTDRELQDIIRQTVNEQVSQSRLRSGF